MLIYSSLSDSFTPKSSRHPGVLSPRGVLIEKKKSLLYLWETPRGDPLTTRIWRAPRGVHRGYYGIFRLGSVRAWPTRQLYYLQSISFCYLLNLSPYTITAHTRSCKSFQRCTPITPSHSCNFNKHENQSYVSSPSIVWISSVAAIEEFWRWWYLAATSRWNYLWVKRKPPYRLGRGAASCGLSTEKIRSLSGDSFSSQKAHIICS